MSSEAWYLAVPYAEKDEAKRLGARWDPRQRAWYVVTGSGASPVGGIVRWMRPGTQPVPVPVTVLPRAHADTATRPAKRARTAVAIEQAEHRVKCFFDDMWVSPQEAYDEVWRGRHTLPRGARVRLCATISSFWDPDARRASLKTLGMLADDYLSSHRTFISIDLTLDAGGHTIDLQEIAHKLAPWRTSRCSQLHAVRLLDVRNGNALLRGLPRAIPAATAQSKVLGVSINLDGPDPLHPFDPPHAGVQCVYVKRGNHQRVFDMAAVRAFAQSVPKVKSLCVSTWLRAECVALSQAFPRLTAIAGEVVPNS